MTYIIAAIYLALALKIWSSEWSLDSLLVGLFWPAMCAVLLGSPGRRAVNGAGP